MNEKKKRHSIFLSACTLLVIQIVGCGGGEPADDRPDRTPVSGKVTYNGTPVEGAMVTFKPAAADGRGATGRTDAEGNYSLGTFEGGDGAIPGSYSVTITKIKVEAASVTVSEDDPNYDGGASADQEPAEPKNELPAKYADATSSALEATIGEEAVTDLNFELTD